MKLRNKLPHMFGGRVNVKGCIYEIDSSGVIVSVYEEHGALLLQNDAWVRVDTAVVRKPIGPKLEQSIDYSKLKKSELIQLCEYKKIEFDKDMKKFELIDLLEKDE